MKETKHFFGKDNRLNKGYGGDSDPKESDHSFYRKRFESIFPPVDAIEAFENLHIGAAEKIIKLAEQEQEHRHAMERVTLATYERAKRFGMICALFTVLIISYISLDLFKLSKNIEAIIFLLITFGTIFGISLLSYLKSMKYRERKFSHHTPYNNNTNNTSQAPRPRRQVSHYNNTRRRRYN